MRGPVRQTRAQRRIPAAAAWGARARKHDSAGHARLWLL